jgi:hypothetical protein
VNTPRTTRKPFKSNRYLSRSVISRAASAEAVSAAEAVSIAGDVTDLGRRAREDDRERGRSRFPSAEFAEDDELARARGAARVWAAGTTRLVVAARLDIGAMRRVAKVSVRFISGEQSDSPSGGFERDSSLVARKL